jgi:hypothetical protein
MTFISRLSAFIAMTIAALAIPGAAEARNCGLFGNLKSVDSGQQITVTFVNRSGMFRHVDWIDYQGNPISYRGLNPGESYVQSTFVGHPWMITNGPGDCIDIIIPRRNLTVNLK